jgi:hypothetical protein
MHRLHVLHNNFNLTQQIFLPQRGNKVMRMDRKKTAGKAIKQKPVL